MSIFDWKPNQIGFIPGITNAVAPLPVKSKVVLPKVSIGVGNTVTIPSKTNIIPYKVPVKPAPNIFNSPVFNSTISQRTYPTPPKVNIFDATNYAQYGAGSTAFDKPTPILNTPEQSQTINDYLQNGQYNPTTYGRKNMFEQIQTSLQQWKPLTPSGAKLKSLIAGGTENSAILGGVIGDVPYTAPENLQSFGTDLAKGVGALGGMVLDITVMKKIPGFKEGMSALTNSIADTTVGKLSGQEILTQGPGFLNKLATTFSNSLTVGTEFGLQSAATGKPTKEIISTFKQGFTLGSAGEISKGLAGRLSESALKQKLISSLGFMPGYGFASTLINGGTPQQALQTAIMFGAMEGIGLLGERGNVDNSVEKLGFTPEEKQFLQDRFGIMKEAVVDWAMKPKQGGIDTSVFKQDTLLPEERPIETNKAKKNILGTENVDIKTLDLFKEFDRAKTPGLNTTEDINKLKLDIQKNGVKEPLIIAYYKGDNTARLIEGNNRLMIAKELGLKNLPVKVIRYEGKGGEGAIKVKGFIPNEHGYIPQDLLPSEIGINKQPELTPAAKKQLIIKKAEAMGPEFKAKAESAMSKVESKPQRPSTTVEAREAMTPEQQDQLHQLDKESMRKVPTKDVEDFNNFFESIKDEPKIENNKTVVEQLYDKNKSTEPSGLIDDGKIKIHKTIGGWAKRMWYRASSAKILTKFGNSGKLIYKLVNANYDWTTAKYNTALFDLIPSLERLKGDEEFIKGFKDMVESGNVPDKYKEVYDAWTNVAKKIDEIARKYIPGYVGISDGYFPWTLKDDILKELRKMSKDDAITRMTYEGISESDAIDIYDTQISSTPIYGHLEISRKGTNIPKEWLNDNPFEILPKYLNGAYRRLGDIIHFGYNDKVLKDLYKNAYKGGQDEVNLRKYTEETIGRNATALLYANKAVSDWITGPTSAALLPLNAVQNIGDFTKMFVRYGMKRGTVAVMKVFMKKYIDLVRKSGVNKYEISKFTQDMGFSKSFGDRIYKWTGQRIIEEGVRASNMIAANDTVRSAFNYLKKNPKGFFSGKRTRVLEEHGLDPEAVLKQDKLTEEQWIQVAITATKSTQPVGPTAIPLGWRTPLGRILTQFMPFGYKHAIWLKDVVGKEAIRGNFGPLIRYAVVGALLGEGVSDMLAWLRGKDRTGNIPQRIAQNILQIGGIGLYYNIMNNVLNSQTYGWTFVMGAGPGLYASLITGLLHDGLGVVQGKDFAPISEPRGGDEIQLLFLKRFIKLLGPIGPITSQYMYPSDAVYGTDYMTTLLFGSNSGETTTKSKFVPKGTQKGSTFKPQGTTFKPKGTTNNKKFIPR